MTPSPPLLQRESVSGPRLSRPLFQTLCFLLEGANILLTGLAADSIARLLCKGGPPVPDLSEIPLCLAAGISYVLLAIILDCFSAVGRIADPGRSGRTLRLLAAIFICFALFRLALGPTDARQAVWFAAWPVLALSGMALLLRLYAGLEPRLVIRRSLVPQVVIAGSGTAAIPLIDTTRSPTGQEIELLGFFDDRRARAELLKHRLPYLGPLGDLVEYAARHRGVHVYMAFPWTAGPRIFDLLLGLRFLPVTVWLLPDPTLPVLSMHPAMSTEGIAMPLLMAPPSNSWGRLAKTVLDYALCFALAPLSVPLMLGIALLIKLDDGGPILFRQVRRGQHGREFSIYKFRTLNRADADADVLVSRGDPRVTGIGRFLRKLSLDELPQILNVLKGEMSLVGPRPHAPKAKANGRIYSDVIPVYDLRHQVKPGMTGWAQVNGWCGETDTEEKLRKRVQFDFEYIKNWSFWLDVEILFRTIPAILLPRDDA